MSLEPTTHHLRHVLPLGGTCALAKKPGSGSQGDRGGEAKGTSCVHPPSQPPKPGKANRLIARGWLCMSTCRRCLCVGGAFGLGVQQARPRGVTAALTTREPQPP